MPIIIFANVLAINKKNGLFLIGLTEGFEYFYQRFKKYINFKLLEIKVFLSKIFFDW